MGDNERLDLSLSTAELGERVRARRDRAEVVGALKELQRRESPGRAELFGAVLADAGQDLSARRTAAHALGMERRPENQELLLRGMDGRNPRVFATVAQALGRIGDEQALERLEKADPAADATARRAVEFARRLISYRLRLDRHFMPVPAPAELLKVEEAAEIRAEPADPRTVRQALADVRGELPAVPLSAEGALRLVCGGRELLVVFAEGFHRPEGLASLRERSGLPVVLLANGLSLERWFLEQYLFAHPAREGGEVELAGARGTGEQGFAGRVRLTEEGAAFWVRAPAARYLPAIEVEGRYDPAGGSLELTRAVSGTRVVQRGESARVPRPAAPRLG